MVKTHPGIGATLIQEHPLGNLALPAVHQHHEWINGKGYPGGLQGNQISIFARIVSIACTATAIPLWWSRPLRRAAPMISNRAPRQVPSMRLSPGRRNGSMSDNVATRPPL